MKTYILRGPKAVEPQNQQPNPMPDPAILATVNAAGGPLPAAFAHPCRMLLRAYSWIDSATNYFCDPETNSIGSGSRVARRRDFREIADRIEFLAGLQVGLDQLDRGQTIEHEEVKRQLASWLTI